MDGNLSIDDESTDYGWIPLNKALDMCMTNSQKIRVRDVIEYVSSGKTSVS